MKDKLQRFLFEDKDIRGETVQLDESWTKILSHHEYPPIIQQYLGEMMAATVLLAATLKIEGSLSIQASGNGKINLLITECRNNLSIRAIAKYNKKEFTQDEQQFKQHSNQQAEETADLSTLLAKGSLVITIEQTNGQRYQGIVQIKGNSIATMLENHLLQSEQLKTKIFLASSSHKSAGLLLQELPHQDEAIHNEDWNEMSLLADTLTQNEILSLDGKEITYRLFNEYDIRQFDPEPVQFECTCSQEKVSKMLLSLDYQEAKNIIHQSEFIEVACEFCNQQYRFDELDISEIFSEQQKPTLH